MFVKLIDIKSTIQSDHSTDCQMSTRLCIFMCDTFPDYVY